MKIIRKSEVQEHRGGTAHTAHEYPSNVKDINGAVIQLSGRFPDHGRAMNEVCTELIYIIDGSGVIVVEGKEIAFEAGDILIIEPGEKYYWQARATQFVAATPAWYPEQHKQVK